MFMLLIAWVFQNPQIYRSWVLSKGRTQSALLAFSGFENERIFIDSLGFYGTSAQEFNDCYRLGYMELDPSFGFFCQLTDKGKEFLKELKHCST